MNVRMRINPEPSSAVWGDMREDSAWRQGLKKFYGVSASRKWQKLAADIECVANGLKPAYLLDTLSPNPHLFRSFLDHVLSEQRGSGPQRSAVVQKWLVELRVVSLGLDVLLINKTAVEKLFQSSCVYVDISETENRTRSEKPDVHIRIHSSSDVEEQCRHCYSTLMATELQQTALEPSKSNSVILLSAPLEPDLNVCTLFGRLLGYPVVYWFPPSTDYCLEYVDLVRHQVTLSSGSHSLGKDHQLYSFTVPRCVESCTSDTVAAWFQGLSEKAVMLGMKLNMSQSAISLPTVVL